MKRAIALRYALLGAVLAAFVCGIVARVLRASAAMEMPRVELNANNIGPRELEDLTSKSVQRDYAFAWQTMRQALEENRPGLLDGYFTGLAKKSLTERVNCQLKSGLRTRTTDRGHHLEAIFYSPAGDVMQLRDRAQVDVQVLDGDKVLYEGPENLQYTVLMTPGADRWLVRELQAMNGEKP